MKSAEAPTYAVSTQHILRLSPRLFPLCKFLQFQCHCCSSKLETNFYIGKMLWQLSYVDNSESKYL